jgi:type I restriction enzyme S subunit
MMQELLTKGIGHTKFKDSPVGKIPESWEVVSFENTTSEIFLGLTTKVDYVESNGVPLVRATDVNTGFLSFEKVKYISQAQHKQLTKFRMAKRGDVLVTKSGTLGICAIVDSDKEFSIYESIIVVRGNEKLDSRFLLWLLRDSGTQLRLMGGQVGSTIGHLNLEMFRKLLIQLPTIKEQHKIAGALDVVQNKIDSLTLKLEKNIVLKKGLMNDLLTGKVRVKV